MTLIMRLVAMIILLAMLNPGFADFYQAPLQQAHWEFKKTGSSCYLKQQIPLYGTADFVHKPGQPLKFSIQELRHKPLIIKASLKIMPAPWMHEEISSLDYPVYLDNAEIGGYGQLSVHGEAAETMIDMLLQGHYPTFIYIRDASALNLEETRVAVSAIKFAESYKAFSECRNSTRNVSSHNNQAALSKKSKTRS
jgi:sodium-type flagellar protein MotY